MLKYLETAIVLSEIPDHITLAINITNCPFKCEGCHSAYLRENLGEELTYSSLRTLIINNPDVSCISFMGGDSDPERIYQLASFIKHNYSYLKVAWYSGRDYLYTYNKEFPNYMFNFIDYIKLGHYDKNRGPLNNRNTNQRLYYLNPETNQITDITYRFWN